MTNETPLKQQAEEIMVALDRGLQHVEDKTLAEQVEIEARSNLLFRTIFGVINDVDLVAAGQRVEALRQKYPQASPTELSQKLIREKSKKTGTVGAVTSSAGVIPGLGTAAAVTLGVAADIGATFKLQAELVLEIAAVYNYPLSEQEKQQIVLFITGLSAGTSALTRKAGQAVAIRVGEKLVAQSAQKAFAKALPVVGVLASAGTNVLSTYLIGQRADAYFREGPAAVGSWADSLRTISGVDERKLAGWLAENSKSAGSALAVGAGKVGEAGKVAGDVVSSGTGRVAATARSAFWSYVRWVRTVRALVLGWLGRLVRVVGRVISFVPGKIWGRFKRKTRPELTEGKSDG
jgi:hypothetical protein